MPRRKKSWYSEANRDAKPNIRRKANGDHPIDSYSFRDYTHLQRLELHLRILDWINDAQMRIAENLGVGVHRISVGLVIESCLNPFLRDYKDFEAHVWSNLLYVMWEMRREEKRNVVYEASPEQKDQLNEAVEWIKHNVGIKWCTRGSVTKFALLYYLNVIDPRQKKG